MGMFSLFFLDAHALLMKKILLSELTQIKCYYLHRMTLLMKKTQPSELTQR